MPGARRGLPLAISRAMIDMGVVPVNSQPVSPGPAGTSGFREDHSEEGSFRSILAVEEGGLQGSDDKAGGTTGSQPTSGSSKRADGPDSAVEREDGRNDENSGGVGTNGNAVFAGSVPSPVDRPADISRVAGSAPTVVSTAAGTGALLEGSAVRNGETGAPALAGGASSGTSPSGVPDGMIEIPADVPANGGLGGSKPEQGDTGASAAGSKAPGPTGTALHSGTEALPGKPPVGGSGPVDDSGPVDGSNATTPAGSRSGPPGGPETPGVAAVPAGQENVQVSKTAVAGVLSGKRVENTGEAAPEEQGEIRITSPSPDLKAGKVDRRPADTPTSGPDLRSAAAPADLPVAGSSSTQPDGPEAGEQLSPVAGFSGPEQSRDQSAAGAGLSPPPVDEGGTIPGGPEAAGNSSNPIMPAGGVTQPNAAHGPHAVRDTAPTVPVDRVPEEIVSAVRKGQNGIELRLEPRELGNLRIDIQVRDGVLNAHITAAKGSTARAVELRIADLRATLAAGGLEVGRVSVEGRPAPSNAGDGFTHDRPGGQNTGGRSGYDSHGESPYGKRQQGHRRRFDEFV